MPENGEVFLIALFQLFELGQDGGENEGDGEVVAESEEVAFECGGR